MVAFDRERGAVAAYCSSRELVLADLIGITLLAPAGMLSPTGGAPTDVSIQTVPIQSFGEFQAVSDEIVVRRENLLRLFYEKTGETAEVETEYAKVREHGLKVLTPALPACEEDVPFGRNRVTIRNPNSFAVSALVRLEEFAVEVSYDAGKEKIKKIHWGRSLLVPEYDSCSVDVPDGNYEIYFVYWNEADALYQGDSFALKGGDIEIQIVEVADGNYGIRRIE